MKCILGIDPGLNTTGFGLVRSEGRALRLVDAGAIRPDAHAPLSERLLELHSALSDIIREHRPHVLVLEEVYSHYRFPQTSVIMAHGRGVICLAAAQAGIPLRPIAATEMKKMLTGNGRASKLQVQEVVCRMLGLRSPISPVDITDALALALTYALKGGD